MIGIYLGLENITISLSDIEGKILKTEKQRIEQITKVKEQTFKLLKNLFKVKSNRNWSRNEWNS